MKDRRAMNRMDVGLVIAMIVWLSRSIWSKDHVDDLQSSKALFVEV